MNRIPTLIVALLFIFCCVDAFAQKNNAIYSGIPWFDEKGNTVSAHGGCIIKDKRRYYFFGEKHSDTSNAFAGFNCYSSTDLYNWKFESIALPVQPSGKLGPNRVGERVKVMQCPQTGEYIMYMHTDTLGYKDQFVGYATSNNITGPYNFKGPLLFNGQPIRKWDMGTFQDKDGAGYILIHGGEIYKLGDDYKTVVEQVNENMTAGFESPAILRKDNIYYLLGSDLTSWERNDNYYYTATSLKGPWAKQGFFAPAGTLTWNSQTTFVLPIEGSEETTFVFMGDRWSFPKQASAATYVWQPIIVSGNKLSIPSFQQAWQINLVTGRVTVPLMNLKTIGNGDTASIKYKGIWEQQLTKDISASRTDMKDASFSISFKGTRVGFYTLKGPAGAYAWVMLRNGKGEAICSTIVDIYCKYQGSSLQFLSPVLPKGKYTLTVTAMRERSNWSDKRRNDYGSTGYFFSLDKVIIKE